MYGRYLVRSGVILGSDYQARWVMGADCHLRSAALHENGVGNATNCKRNKSTTNQTFPEPYLVGYGAVNILMADVL